MRKSFLFLLFCLLNSTIISFSQDKSTNSQKINLISFSIGSDLNFGTQKFFYDPIYPAPSIDFGISYYYSLTDRLGIESGLLYHKLWYRNELIINNIDSYAGEYKSYIFKINIATSYISIPFYLKYYFPCKKSRIYFLTGPKLNLWFTQKTYVYNNVHDVSTNTTTISEKLVYDNIFNRQEDYLAYDDFLEFRDVSNIGYSIKFGIEKNITKNMLMALEPSLSLTHLIYFYDKSINIGGIFPFGCGINIKLSYINKK